MDECRNMREGNTGSATKRTGSRNSDTVYEDSDDVRVPDKVFDARFEVVHPLP